LWYTMYVRTRGGVHLMAEQVSAKPTIEKSQASGRKMCRLAGWRAV
jgi:hypothetical protein